MINYEFENLNHIKIKGVSNGNPCRGNRTFCVNIDGEEIVVKKFSNKKFYDNEKKVYTVMKDEDYLPKMKYYNDEKMMIGITYVGNTLARLPKKFIDFFGGKELCKENVWKEVRKIKVDMMEKYKFNKIDNTVNNICIDETGTVRLIDFDISKFITKKIKFDFETSN